jgi:hypothetical protein
METKRTAKLVVPSNANFSENGFSFGSRVQSHHVVFDVVAMIRGFWKSIIRMVAEVVNMIKADRPTGFITRLLWASGRLKTWNYFAGHATRFIG